MNDKNFDYLKDQLKYLGFGSELASELKEKMHKGAPEFTLYHQGSFEGDHMAAALHFRRAQGSELYFFNRYQVSLQKENSPEKLNQTFYIGKSGNITLKEAYNLLSGRAVHKELTNKDGQTYGAWLQLDLRQTEEGGNYKLRQFHDNYGFDLEKTLAQYPIKELKEQQYKAVLLKTLQKGNRPIATLEQNGKEQKVLLQTVPQFKAVHFFDEKGVRIKPLSLQQKQEQKQEHKEEQKQTTEQSTKEKVNQKTTVAEEGGAPAPKQKRSRKQKQSLS